MLVPVPAVLRSLFISILIVDKAFDLVVAVCIQLLTLIWAFELNPRPPSITKIPFFLSFLKVVCVSVKIISRDELHKKINET